VFGPVGAKAEPGVRIVPVRHVREALSWAAKGYDQRPT